RRPANVLRNGPHLDDRIHRGGRRRSLRTLESVGGRTPLATWSVTWSVTPMNVDPTTKAGQIVACHLQHPNFTREKIAKAPGIKQTIVNTVVQRYPLAVPSAHLAHIKADMDKRKPQGFRKFRYAGQIDNTPGTRGV